MGEYLQKVTNAMRNIELDEIGPLLKEAMEQGVAPFELLNAMGEGITKVGELFERGEYFLAELVLAGEMMKEGVDILKPFLKTDTITSKGTVVLCTVKGDIHDIGKNLVRMMLTSAGFKVIDLGVDVPAEEVVRAVKENSAETVALSVLLTTMTSSIRDVVDLLNSQGLRGEVKILIGGACTSSRLAETMGADAWGKSAVDAVKIVQSWLAE